MERKIDALPQNRFIDALESSKDKLFNGNARQILEKELKQKFIDADDLMDGLRNNKEWFNKIFIKSGK